MTRKDFMLEVTEVLAQNPRGILQGHGIAPTVLKQISARPDIMGKLAAFLYSTKYAKKGAVGLKKQKNFKISGYKNFAEFNLKGRQDVEKFMSSLDPKDADTFQNNENILVLVALPDTQSGDLESDMVSGKSIVTKFDTAIKKEQKSIGGFYITIMWGNSAIRPAEEKLAKAKAKVNAVKVEKSQGTVAKIKRKLTSKERKVASKAANLQRTNRKLAHKAQVANAHLDELSSLGKRFVGAQTTNVTDIKRGMNSYNTATKRVLSKLTPEEKSAYERASKLMKSGDSRKAKGILRTLGNEDVTNIVLNGNLTDSKSVLSARRKELRTQISKLNDKAARLVDKKNNATSARARAQANFDLKKTQEQIKILNARIKTTSDISGKTKQSKVGLIKKINQAIATNLELGKSFRESLNNVMAKVPVSEQVKQQIKQQVIETVANGGAAQFAVQQAVQQIPVVSLQQLPVQQTPVKKAVRRLTNKAGLAKQGMKKYLGGKKNGKVQGGFQQSAISQPQMAGNRNLNQLFNVLDL